MAIQFQIIIQDEGLLDSQVLVALLNRVDRSCRNAAVMTTIQISNDRDLPVGLIHLASLRLWTQREGFFLIERVQPGSKILIGKILAGALITTALNNTIIGESIRDGWRQTASHTYISTSIPKIEKKFVEEFRRLFDGEHNPFDERLDISPLAIKTDDDELSIVMRTRQKEGRSTE